MEQSIKTAKMEVRLPSKSLIAALAIVAIVGMFASGSAFAQLVPPVHSEGPNPALVKPSFGGVPLHQFHDGLSITSNGQKNIFDISGYAAAIPQQKFEVGQAATFTIKWQPNYGSYAWKHIAIFYNFGEGGSLPSESDSAISMDNIGGNEVVTVQDPHHFLTGVRAGNLYDASTVYSNFQFTPTKYMPDSAIFIQAWDSQQRVASIYVAGAMQFGEPATGMIKIDPNTVKFTSFGNMMNYLTSNGYVLPQAVSKIHSSKDVFMGQSGSVYWTVNTKTETLSVMAEQNGKTLFTQSAHMSTIPSTIPSIDGW